MKICGFELNPHTNTHSQTTYTTPSTDIITSKNILFSMRKRKRKEKERQKKRKNSKRRKERKEMKSEISEMENELELGVRGTSQIFRSKMIGLGPVVVLLWTNSQFDDPK